MYHYVSLCIEIFLKIAHRCPTSNWTSSATKILLCIILFSCTNKNLPFFLFFSFGLGVNFSQFSSVQSLSRVRLSSTPWISACQASLSITNARSSLRLTSIESVMPSSHLILCRPVLLLPSIPPSIRVFSNESSLFMRWPKYWSFSFSIIPSK